MSRQCSLYRFPRPARDHHIIFQIFCVCFCVRVTLLHSVILTNIYACPALGIFSVFKINNSTDSIRWQVRFTDYKPIRESISLFIDHFCCCIYKENSFSISSTSFLMFNLIIYLLKPALVDRRPENFISILFASEGIGVEKPVLVSSILKLISATHLSILLHLSFTLSKHANVCKRSTKEEAMLGILSEGKDRNSVLFFSLWKPYRLSYLA